jgi:hypothetical protein
MRDLIRLLLLLGIVASTVTLVGAIVSVWLEEQRRLGRIARRVLGGEPDGMIIAQGRNAAAAFRVGADQILVMREGGADALLYRLASLKAAELCVDGDTVARVAQGEASRPLERMPRDPGQVVLRLEFNDARHAEFELELWLPSDADRRRALPPEEVIQEARAWLNRAEAIIRRVRMMPPGGEAFPHMLTVPSSGGPRFTEPEPAPPFYLDADREPAPPRAPPGQPRLL